ncbi:hypothetical protein [Cystobacter ferrugineus]|uniref:Uncharacterized protein n=1 Tax=Cystobacter ferrugineus TaxID=83449 RepID=A0A1L9AX78_9BACT|nr:hypothetical protein [Cystobacter ferrugineus]OJH34609.1 hypothetical protein BON30_43230 [Cystobacter ferrugineus]
MMKALKAGLFGLAMGALGAVALPAQEAAADEPAKYIGCCSACNPWFQQCLISAGTSQAKIAQCAVNRTSCESTCNRTC